MDEEDKLVECVECGDIHTWSKRVRKYNPKYCWTSNFCPKCGEESYYSAIDKDLSESKQRED